MRETKICDLCKTSFTHISELNRFMNKKTCLKKGLEARVLQGNNKEHKRKQL